jgi:hypothetical protein
MKEIENRAIWAVQMQASFGIGDDGGFGVGTEIETTKRSYCKSQVK